MRDRKTSSQVEKVNHRSSPVESGTVKPVPKNVDRTCGRHTAITNNLENWSSYRSWAQKKIAAPGKNESRIHPEYRWD